MEVITSPAAMQHWSEDQRRAGVRLGLVPTMGYLHAGHLALVAESRRRTDRTIASIFVNPTQFGPNEDLARYPRDVEHDTALLTEAGTDALFLPEAAEVYPPGFETHVEVEVATKGLCGAFRPTHFRGVTTVVAKLFNLTRPHVAVFGTKDYQQFAAIRRMVRDLNFDIDIVGVPTVRDADGLAMSSRNAYLSPGERAAARCLPRALAAARAAVADGERDGLRVVAVARQILAENPAIRIEYVSLADPATIREVFTVTGPTLLAAAIWVGKTRLIDNAIVGESLGSPAASDRPTISGVKGAL